MNFFGHAVVASWTDREPAFVFGAMLPDFQTMLRTQSELSRSPRVAEGVAHHHRTDADFHARAAFIELVATGVGELRRAGVARGAARAAAHIGVELLLDRELSRDSDAAAAYLRALAHAPELAEPTLEGTRLCALTSALLARGVSDEHTTGASIASRIAHALRGRPRLALSAAELAPIAAWAEATRGAVGSRAAELTGAGLHGKSAYV